MDERQYDRLLSLILDVQKDGQETKEIVIEQSVIAKGNTRVLEEHARRSTASEQRIEKLEDQSKLIDFFVKIVLGLLGVAGTIFGIIEVIHVVLLDK